MAMQLECVTLPYRCGYSASAVLLSLVPCQSIRTHSIRHAKCDESPLHVVSLGNSPRGDRGNAVGATKRRKL